MRTTEAKLIEVTYDVLLEIEQTSFKMYHLDKYSFTEIEIYRPINVSKLNNLTATHRTMIVNGDNQTCIKIYENSEEE